jgi:hypothetical protein
VVELYLRCNQLTSLPNDLFTGMENLRFISFYSNEITHLSPEILSPILLNNFKLIDFRDNLNINAMYDPNGSGKTFSSIVEFMIKINLMCLKPKKDLSGTAVFKDSLASNFKELWETGKMSDFIIIADGPKHFFVHKLVLGMQSSVFAGIFERNVDQSELKIQNIGAEAVEQFLCFLYTAKVEPDANWMEIFALAAKFKVDSLKTFSETMVANEVDETNALKVITLAQNFSSDIMKQSAFEKIREMFPQANLPDELMNDFEKLKELIEAKRKLDLVVQQIHEFYP